MAGAEAAEAEGDVVTIQDEVLWRLRIYEPCSMADVAKTIDKPRGQVVAAMTRLRNANLAERTMRRTYRLTDAGRRRVQSLGLSLFV